MIYFFLSALFVILYTYRHLFLVLYFKSILSDDLSYKDASRVSVYRFPRVVSEENYFCKTINGIICLLPVGELPEQPMQVIDKIKTLPSLRYFFYSIFTFSLALFFSFNSFILSVFFERKVVIKMLFIFPWLHVKAFDLFFGKKFFCKSDNMVLF